jgi:hypothetical protein
MSRSGRALFGVLALAPLPIVDIVAPEPPVEAVNTPPSVVIEAPADGSVLDPGAQAPFRVTVTDTEDGVVGCAMVVVQGAVVAPDCTGVLTAGDAVSASYTDSGGLTGAAEVVLHPREQVVDPSFGVPHINLAGISHLTAKLATWQPGAILTVHADSPEGPVVATFPPVPETGAWVAADVLDPVGVHDLYFVGDQVSVETLRFQTVPAVTATVPPANGWHTTDVPVTVSAAPLWDPQVSLDGGVSWQPAPVVLAADGAYDVRYRAIDAAGRTSEPGAAAVRIDRTAPVLTAPPREQARMATLELAAPADATSGVATFAATLDGAPVAGPVELWRLPAGVHQLTMTATDAAGNTATQTSELAVTTSLPDLLPMLTRFNVPFVKQVILRLQLMAAQRAYDAGFPGETMTWVRAFQRSASVLRDPAARTTLTADAALVFTQLGSA